MCISRAPSSSASKCVGALWLASHHAAPTTLPTRVPPVLEPVCSPHDDIPGYAAGVAPKLNWIGAQLKPLYSRIFSMMFDILLEKWGYMESSLLDSNDIWYFFGHQNPHNPSLWIHLSLHCIDYVAERTTFMGQMERVIHLDVFFCPTLPHFAWQFWSVIILTRTRPTIKDLDNCDLFGGQGAIQTAFHSKLKSKFSKTLARIVLNFIYFTLARLHWDYNPRFGPFNHQCES